VSGLFGLLGHLFENFQSYIHASKERAEVIQNLESHGLRKGGVPSYLGGSWSFKRFSQWLTGRALIDQARKSGKAPAAASRNTAMTATRAVGVASLSAAAAYPEDNDYKTSSTIQARDGVGIGEVDNTLRHSASRPHESTAFRRRESDEEYCEQLDEEDSKPPANSSGVGIADPESVEIMENGQHQLEKRIQHLPQEETGAYIEALEMAPSRVWKEECNPDIFLRLESFQEWPAVKRLARYWQLRSETFGPKRFDSLYQTGEDALERGDLSVLGTGFSMILPNDADGSSVIWIDGSRLRSDTTSESRDKCLFYMFSVLTENEMSQQDGAVLLYNMDSSPFDCIDVTFLNNLADAMPLRFKAVHFFSHEDKPADVESQMSFGSKTYFHAATSKDKLAPRLEAFGMRKSGLPQCLDGEWEYNKFVHWQELRTRMEWKVPLGIGGRESEEALSFGGIKRYSILPEEEKTERKRRLNVIHSRRKRDRKRVATGVIQERCSALRRQQKRLLEENRRLEELVCAATSMAECAEEEHIM
jgi:hypothetical protein